MLPVTEKKLKEEVDKYFERCAQEDVPPTPSGLALALGVRTAALKDERLSIPQRTVLDRAMQRIEAKMVEMMIARGGVKGIESVLERVAESGEKDRAEKAVRRLTDQEIEERMKKAAAKIKRMLGE